MSVGNLSHFSTTYAKHKYTNCTEKTENRNQYSKILASKNSAYIMREWKKHLDEVKNFLGSEYQDFNLVVPLDNGRPCKKRIIEKKFTNLKNNLANRPIFSFWHEQP